MGKKHRQNKKKEGSLVVSSNAPGWRRHLIALAVLCVFGGLIYANSFRGIFHFDDYGAIIDNPKIRSLSWPWAFAENVRRPFLNFTLALNYAMGQEQPFGYHVVNLGIHLAAAFLLYLILRETFLEMLKRGTASFLNHDTGRGFLPALSASVLWMAHPLQVQSVTYIIQRAESLMGMLFFLSLYSAVRYFYSERTGWIFLAGASSVLSGLTKEVAVTIPLTVLLYDRVFVSSSFREGLRRHAGLYFSLSVTWIIMFYLLFTTKPEADPTAGFSYKGITPLQYAATQPGIILHYLKLSFWPHPLVVDYGWPPVRSFGEAAPAGALILLILVAGAAAFRKFPAAGFLVVTFFLILSPSSSFIPLKDLAFEHRMYLPLSCVVTFFIATLWRGMKNSAGFAAITIVIAAVFGFLTHQRNVIYADRLTFWRDIVEKRPDNARGHNNYGRYLIGNSPPDDVLFHLKKAVELQPDYADAWLNLGSAYMSFKQYDLAIEYSKKSIGLNPKYPVAYNNLGAALMFQKKCAEAIPYFEKTILMGFKEPGVFHNLGYCEAMIGNMDEAVSNMEKTVRLDSNSAEAKEHLREFRAIRDDLKQKEK